MLEQLIGNIFRGLVPAEVTIASAATCDIGSAKSSRVEITGTTTITSFGTVPNRRRRVRFSGVLTLTHNATTLILPTGLNITTAAGDVCEAESDASGNWRVIRYQRANGLPLAESNALTLLGAYAMAGASTIDFTSAVLTSAYDRYLITLDNVMVQTDDVWMGLQVGTGAGPTWQSGAGAYSWAAAVASLAAASMPVDNPTTFAINTAALLTLGGAGNRISNATNERLSGHIHLSMPTEAANKAHWNSEINYVPSSIANLVCARGNGNYTSAAAITGLRLMLSSGTFTAGTARIYGLRRT
jgi:hypothetical protein